MLRRDTMFCEMTNGPLYSKPSPNDRAYSLIHRFLVLAKRAPIPSDSSMLRISSQAFRILSSSLHLPVSFIYALSRYHLPSGRGFFTRSTNTEEDWLHEMWYILPVRVQYKCNDKAKEHEGS